MVSVKKDQVVQKLIIVWLWVCINHVIVTWQLKKDSVLERSIRMYNNPLMSDIKFTYKNCNPGQELYAHKYVLATSSHVFEEMFDGHSPTKNSVINLSDIDKEIVEAFLAYLYKDECPNSIDVMFGVLRLTQKYEIPSFVEACRNDLQQKAPEKVTATQAFQYLETFVKLNEPTMMEVCWSYIDKHTDEFFASEYFLRISQVTLSSLLRRDTLSSNEKAIFEAMVKWADNQCSEQKLHSNPENRRQILGDAIYEIRFHTMAGSTSGQLSTWEQILSDSEVISLQKAMNGEKVPNLKWDLSKQKRGVATIWDIIIGVITIIIIALTSIKCFPNLIVTIQSFLILLVFTLIVYWYGPQVFYKFVQIIIYIAKMFGEQ